VEATGLSPHGSSLASIWCLNAVDMSQRALIELLRGKGAHVDPIACMEDISAELASQQVNGFPHSIGQLVFHMNYWMDYELRRMRWETPKYPEHNAESFAVSSLVDAEEWERQKKNLARLLQEFAVLAKSLPEELQKQVEIVQQQRDTQLAGTVEAVLWQTVSHNSYHVGQIAMLRRALGAWPPPGGGDSW
jgi:uncharacterized damage-inducible protein DinB